MDITTHKFLIDKGVKSISESISVLKVKEWLKEYALEIASDAFDEGFAYGIGSHRDFVQTGLNKFEYSQKLKNEIFNNENKKTGISKNENGNRRCCIIDFILFY